MGGLFRGVLPSEESELIMALFGGVLSLSPAAENTTITLGRGSALCRSWMKRLTRVVVALGSALKDRGGRSLSLPSEEPGEAEPFCCMRAEQPRSGLRSLERYDEVEGGR